MSLAAPVMVLVLLALVPISLRAFHAPVRSRLAPVTDVETQPHPTPATALDAKPRPIALAGIPVAPRALNFLQEGLHNCGAVSMLESWARLHRKEAASLVRRQRDGNWQVDFAGAGPVEVTPEELAQARAARLVGTAPGDPWALVVLTAFTKLKSGGDPLDFHTIEWMYPGDLAVCLSGNECQDLAIKPEHQDAQGRIQVGDPVPLPAVDAAMKTVQGHPAVASTNRRIHIWAILGYDPARHLVHLRNPRHPTDEWMPLSEFRDRFELIAWQT